LAGHASDQRKVLLPLTKDRLVSVQAFFVAQDEAMSSNRLHVVLLACSDGAGVRSHRVATRQGHDTFGAPSFRLKIEVEAGSCWNSNDPRSNVVSDSRQGVLAANSLPVLGVPLEQGYRNVTATPETTIQVLVFSALLAHVDNLYVG